MRQNFAYAFAETHNLNLEVRHNKEGDHDNKESDHDNKEGEQEFEAKVSNVSPREVIAEEQTYWHIILIYYILDI